MHDTIAVFSHTLESCVVHEPPSTCFVGWAEDPQNKPCLTTGAIYLYTRCSIQIDGITSFLNNLAGDDGGKARLQMRYIDSTAILLATVAY